MSREIDPVVYSFTHLQDFPRPAAVRALLKDIRDIRLAKARAGLNAMSAQDLIVRPPSPSPSALTIES